MEYSINKLAKMSGVSTRTLRYYDEIGLLKPVRTASSGYRIYGRAQIDTLQQILFYRELDFPLAEIKRLLSAPAFDREQAFLGHLQLLEQRRRRLDALMQNITRSLAAMRGEKDMKDNEKFQGFTQRLVEENERSYGPEIRKKYGDEAVDESNAWIKSMTREQYERSEQLGAALERTLAEALKTGDPAGASAQKACDLHRQWLCIFYPRYSREYHRGLGEMYVSDERFRAYYDKIAPGCADFLREAIEIYCAEPH